MKYFINYADKNFSKQQDYAIKQALKYGFDKSIKYTPSDLPNDFRSSNQILNESKGGGYWLWKSFIILDALKKIDYDDILFYSDSGAFISDDMNPLFNKLNEVDTGLIAFGLPLLELQWSKRELIDSFNDSVTIDNSSLQSLASFILIKKNDFTIKFFEEFLDCSVNTSLLDDSMDVSIQNDKFIMHRHDQSIFSLLCKKYDIEIFRDPSQFGSFPMLFSGNILSFVNKNIKSVILKNGIQIIFKEYKNSDYGQLIFHVRGSSVIKYKMKIIFLKVYSKILGIFDDFINYNSRI